MKAVLLLLCLLLIVVSLPAAAQYYVEGEDIPGLLGTTWSQLQTDPATLCTNEAVADPTARGGAAMVLKDPYAGTFADPTYTRTYLSTQAAGAFGSSATAVFRVKTTSDVPFNEVYGGGTGYPVWDRNFMLVFASGKTVTLSLRPDRAAIVNWPSGVTTKFFPGNMEIYGDNTQYHIWTIVARASGALFDLYRDGKKLINNASLNIGLENSLPKVDEFMICSSNVIPTGSWSIDWVGVCPGEHPEWIPDAAGVTVTGSISGTVYDKANPTAPVPYAVVAIDGGANVTADENGHYTLSSLALGSYSIAASAPGFYTRAVPQPITLATDSSAVTQDIYLVSLPAQTPHAVDTYSRVCPSGADLGTTEDESHLSYISTDEDTTATIGVSGMQGLQLSQWTGAEPHGVSLGGGFLPADFDATLYITIPTTGSVPWVGIAYRQGLPQTAETWNGQTAEDAGYMFRINSDGKNIMLWRNGRLLKAQCPNKINLTIPVQVRIRAIGPHHEIWIEDPVFGMVKVIDYMDSGKLSGGYFTFMRGQGAAGDKYVWLNSLDVTPIGAAPTATITGTVSDAADPAVKIAGATIDYSEDGQVFTATSDANGIYTAALPAGDVVSATVTAPGYATQTITLDPWPGDTLTQDISLSQLPSEKIAYDTFTRDDGAALGTTEDSSHFAWALGSAETDASISGGKLHYGSSVTAGSGASLDGFSATDVDITTDLSMAPDGTWAGIVYRQRDPGTFDTGYCALFRVTGEIDLYYRVPNNIDTNPLTISDPGNVVTVQTSVDWTSGAAHKVRVRATGLRHEIWVDGTKYIDYIDPAKTCGGSVGLVRSASDVYFDNFSAAADGTPVVPPVTYSPVDNTAEAKQMADGMPVQLTGPSITAVFDGCFYIEDSSRASGLKVVGGTALAVNTPVVVQGTMGSADGERFITGDNVSSIGGTQEIKPVGVAGKAVAPSAGLSNVGLLTTVWGRVSSVSEDGSSCVIDDGSDVPLQVLIAGAKKPVDTNYVLCTGVVRMMPGPAAVLQMRSDDDLVIIP